ncbi:hypothetical protein ACJIZ3_009182 [Penstemon smallii]|uniref:Uncharacterized protein n=1 Tax=Penstemon smallii TaxID=265156 RepID=A0ABD3TCW1_9LAMI
MKNYSSSLQIPTHPNRTLIPEEEKEEQNNPQPAHDNDPEEKPRPEWDFSLSTVISSPNSATDAIGVIEFDQSENLLATGGIARRIRIYSVQKSLTSPENGGGGGAAGENRVTFLDHAAACEYYICTPAKLSSLKWKPGSGSRVIGSGDYDGVVMEYDLEKQVPIFERDEHGGRRVCSMDYSNSDPVLGASGSDDGTLQMWDPRCEGGDSIASIQPNRVVSSPVCCVEFNPFGQPIIAVGCADKKIYGYDVRRMVDPVFIFEGHQKSVTYTRFLDSQTMVSSSVDGCLMMWNTEDQSLIRTYRGHVNNRRFVGLSVWRKGGLLSCGSENNRVFVYDKRWGDPIWVRGFEHVGQTRCDRGFVSGVCWRQMEEERCTLVAGSSDGVLQVFEGQRKVPM